MSRRLGLICLVLAALIGVASVSAFESGSGRAVTSTALSDESGDVVGDRIAPSAQSVARFERAENDRVLSSTRLGHDGTVVATPEAASPISGSTTRSHDCQEPLAEECGTTTRGRAPPTTLTSSG